MRYIASTVGSRYSRVQTSVVCRRLKGMPCVHRAWTCHAAKHRNRPKPTANTYWCWLCWRHYQILQYSFRTSIDINRETNKERKRSHARLSSLVQQQVILSKEKEDKRWITVSLSPWIQIKSSLKFLRALCEMSFFPWLFHRCSPPRDGFVLCNIYSTFIVSLLF